MKWASVILVNASRLASTVAKRLPLKRALICSLTKALIRCSTAGKMLTRRQNVEIKSTGRQIDDLIQIVWLTQHVREDVLQSFFLFLLLLEITALILHILIRKETI